jgi:hypothetical protein
LRRVGARDTRRADMKLFACSFLLVAACASKAPVDDDFASFADTKADTFSQRMKIVGTLDYGQTGASVRYTSSPRYRAYKFAGHAGDQVDVWVRSTNGDAVAWVLDNDFAIVGSNDDADDTTLDAHVAVTLPANPSDTHYIVFRDYDLATHYFTVSLDGTAAASCTADADCNAEGVGDGQVAECIANACASVAIGDIHCGGFNPAQHQCPTGYVCHYDSVPDVPGHCIAQ